MLITLVKKNGTPPSSPPPPTPFPIYPFAVQHANKSYQSCHEVGTFTLPPAPASGTSTPSTSPSPSPSSSSPSSSSSSSSFVPAAIAAGVAGISAAVLLGVLICVLHKRRKVLSIGDEEESRQATLEVARRFGGDHGGPGGAGRHGRRRDPFDGEEKSEGGAGRYGEFL